MSVLYCRTTWSMRFKGLLEELQKNGREQDTCRRQEFFGCKVFQAYESQHSCKI